MQSLYDGAIASSNDVQEALDKIAIEFNREELFYFSLLQKMDR